MLITEMLTGRCRFSPDASVRSKYMPSMEVDYYIALRIYKMKSQYPHPNDLHASIDDANENN